MFRLYCTECPYEKFYSWKFNPKKPTAYCHVCSSRKVVIEIGDILTYYENKESKLSVSKTALGWFRSYRRVQESGKFNMITEAFDASENAGLEIEQYKYVVTHFEELSKMAELLKFHKGL